MDTRHLSAVLAVARFGSFTEASRKLFVAQSTLSRQIAAVERAVGGPLFVRGARKVRLTTRGEAFLPAAEDVLAVVARAEQAARNA